MAVSTQPALREWVRRGCARSYVSGSQLRDGIAYSDRLAGSSVSTALSYVPPPDAAPLAVAQRYIEALDAIDRRGANGSTYLSIKASHLDFDAAHVRTVAERARAGGILLHFDATAPDSADTTLALAASLPNPEIGVALPGRWRRSVDDAAVAIDRGYRVRVVKGQWADPSADRTPREGFLAVVDALLASRHTVAVATHDRPLAEAALRRLIEAGTPCELELLLGLPLAGPLELATSLGVGARVYVPYGAPWLPYSLRHVFRRPQIALWAIQDVRLGLDKNGRALAQRHDEMRPGSLDS